MIDVGQTVGNYRITGVLGEGGMGKVFLAEHPVIGSKVALKAIHPQFARNADVVARFVNEARAVNQIGHDHIVDITDFGHTDAGDFYFIMEVLHGDMLSDQIGRVPFPPARAIDIAAQIADALEASHRQGVIHRDLKPDNILLIVRDGTPDFVKVYDFGLAKLTHRPAGAPVPNTEVGIVMGTPFYMSPEQCDARREVDHRADIYALGVILFQMLTGRVPFTGEGFGEVMAQHLTRPAPSVHKFAPQVPAALAAIVARALAKEPGERFQTMAELREALLAAAPRAPALTPARGLPTAGLRAATADALALTDPGATAEPAPIVDLKPRRNRGPALVLATAAFALVAVANLGLHRPATEVVAAAVPAARHAASVRITFSSDPDGATVTRPDGSVVGVTPFSTDIPYGDAPVELVVHKDGYLAKVSAFVPNLPSPVFAVLEKAPEPTPAAPGPLSDGQALAEAKPVPARGRSHDRRAHGRALPPVSAAADADDVMAPSTW